MELIVSRIQRGSAKPVFELVFELQTPTTAGRKH